MREILHSAGQGMANYTPNVEVAQQLIDKKDLTARDAEALAANKFKLCALSLFSPEATKMLERREQAMEIIRAAVRKVHENRPALTYVSPEIVKVRVVTLLNAKHS